MPKRLEEESMEMPIPRRTAAQETLRRRKETVAYFDWCLKAAVDGTLRIEHTEGVRFPNLPPEFQMLGLIDRIEEDFIMEKNPLEAGLAAIGRKKEDFDLIIEVALQLSGLEDRTNNAQLEFRTPTEDSPLPILVLGYEGRNSLLSLREQITDQRVPLEALGLTEQQLVRLERVARIRRLAAKIGSPPPAAPQNVAQAVVSSMVPTIAGF